MSTQPTVLQVVILRDGLLIGTEVFVPGQYTLGSGEAADLRLDDPSVSEAHATLYFQNGKAAVQDQASVLGVFVNGHRVTACEVRPVDEIAIGPFSLKVRVLAQKAPSSKVPPPELAALLGGTAPPTGKPASRPGSGPIKPPATVVSTRRANAPHSPELMVNTVTGPVPPQKHASHDGVFDFDEETMTDAMMVGEEFQSPSAKGPQLKAPRPAPSTHEPVQLKAPPRAAPPPPAATHRKPAQSTKPTELSPSHAPKAARKRSAPSIPASTGGKGAPQLFFELYWGEVRQHARAFANIPLKRPVIGRADDRAAMPLWGFHLPHGKMVLADKRAGAYRVFVPNAAAVERRGEDGNFYPLTADALEAVGQRKFIGLSNGQAVRFSADGEISLVAYVQPPIPRPWSNPLKGLPILTFGLLALFLGLFAAFVSFAPSDEMPDFTMHNMPPVAVRLIAPEPKKKEEAKKKLEEIKKKAPPVKKPEPIVQNKVVKPPPVEPPKIKALEKLTAAGPAMKDLLAAVDKLGNGPGKKDTKNNYKMADLIGKAPIANAGLGTFGLGGGGKGGMGTQGLEVLRGKGGGGIGALGAGNVGKGNVGGTVGHVVAHNMGVQGTIDREAVAKVINSHLHEVSSCYERALLKEPGLAGKIILEWNISIAGTVTSAKTKSSTMKSSAVESCILSALKLWKFPPAKGAGVIISYPFMFNSVGY